MNNIMIDIETLGVQPNSCILSIGAVRFTDTELKDGFYVNVDPATCKEIGMTIDKSTVEWWKGQPKQVRDSLLVDQKPLTEALRSLRMWIGPGKPNIWANGPDFDLVILSQAFELLGDNPPWTFRQYRCYRTMSRLVDVPRPESGLNHNAFDDAKTQALHLIKILGS
jgi:exodeoxyribonuclease VIII